MPGLFPATLDEQIACVDREIRMRKNVYARQVSAGRMSQQTADREIALMSAVLETLLNLAPRAA